MTAHEHNDLDQPQPHNASERIEHMNEWHGWARSLTPPTAEDHMEAHRVKGHGHSAGWPIGKTLSEHLQVEHAVDQATLVMSPDWQVLHQRMVHHTHSSLRPVVYKFPIWPVKDTNFIEMPPLLNLLHYGWQNDIPTLWALVDGQPDAPKSRRKFYLRGTGHAVPLDASYIGSAISHGDGLVTHLFAGRMEPGDG